MQKIRTLERIPPILLSLLLHGGALVLILIVFYAKNRVVSVISQEVSLSEVGERGARTTLPVRPTHEEALHPAPISATKQVISSGGKSGNSVEGSESADQNSYFFEIQRRIQEQERYPIEAQKRGFSGTVIIQFSLNDQGQILEIRSISPEKPTILIEAALTSVKAAAPFPAPPAGISRDFRIPVEFKIR